MQREIETYAAYYAQVAVMPIEVAPRLHRVGKPGLVKVLLLRGRGEEIHIGIGSRIAVHKVAVSLCVLRQLVIVPACGITESHKSPHHDGELPVTPVVDLTETGKQCRHPHRTRGRRIELLLPVKSVGESSAVTTVCTVSFASSKA